MMIIIPKFGFIVGLVFSTILIPTVTAKVVVPAGTDSKHNESFKHWKYPERVIKNADREENESNHHWNYYEQGEWSGICTTGELQSPIALRETSAIKSVIPPVNIENAGYFENFSVNNDGHTVTVRFDTSNQPQPKLSGGGLTKNYTFDHLHFHWPAEHTINGIRYDLEGHFVFFADEYGNLTRAQEYSKGVTVIAVVFTEADTVDYDNFEVINEVMEEILQSGKSAVGEEGLTLSNFFPQNTKAFFKYTGSLTTPECNEGVNWIVFKNPSYILREDLAQLTHIYSEDDELLQFNNRLLQPTNGRITELNRA